MSQVFISYSRLDGEHVNLLVRKLEDTGHTVWLDKSAIQGGARWQEEIVRGIERADVFVIIMTQQSITSEHVEKELGLAYAMNKTILPVMLDRIVIPPRFQYALAQLEMIHIPVQGIAAGSQRLLSAIGSPGRRMGRVNLPRLYRDKLPKHLYFLILIIIGVLDQHTQARLAVIAAAVAGVIVWGARRRLIHHQLKRRGIPLSTELTGFTQTGRQAFCRIASVWRDPETGRRYRFYSEKVHTDISEFVERAIPVIVDPQNFRRYRVDLSFLPREPRGALVTRGQGEAAATGGQPRPEEHDRVSEIFMSHAAQDDQTVRRLIQKLEAAGHTVWTTRTEPEDLSDEERAIHAISGAQLFLLALSPESVLSNRVRTELDMALEKRKRVVTAVLRRTITPEEMDYALVGAQRVDLSEDFELGVPRLLDTITRTAQSETVAPESFGTTCAEMLRRWSRTAEGFVLLFLSQFILAPAILLQYAAKAVPARFSPSLLNQSARIAVWFSRRVNRGNELENRGTVLLTEYKHVREGDEGEQILSQWRDPVSQQLYLFRSAWLPHGAQQYIKTKTIAVYVDPTNLRKYWMDLSLLPEAKRRRNASSGLPVQLQRLTGSSDRWSFESPDAKPAALPGGEDTRKRVFISYSREDADRAALLLSRLETGGYEVVSGTTTGEAKVVDEENRARIGLAGTFLIVVPSPAATDLGLKNRELRYACAANRPILPVTVTDSEIPLSMQLSLAGVQRIDLSRDTEAGIQLLLDALARSNPGRVVKPDSVKDARRASLRGRPRMILFGAMLGAFCWALGSTLSLISLVRGPWMEMNVLAIGLSGLACGGAVGAIFYRPRVSMGVLLPLTFLFWMISYFLTLVAELVFDSRAVRPAAAGDGGDVGGLTILLATLLGATTLIAGKRVETRVRGYWLKKRGKLLLTEYKGLYYDRSEEHNGDHFIQVVSQWRDPVTDELHTFLSEPFVRDPSERIRSASIAVFVDPRNFENYQMDLSSSAGGEFTEESAGQTTRDLRSRLLESLDAVVLGVVLFAASFPVLLLNESDVVRMARSLQEGAKAFVDVPSDRVDPANESKLVHVTGRSTTDGSIADPIFGVSAQAIKLRRKVEMYQWQEASSKAPDPSGVPTETTYSYSLVWSEQPINSGGFNQQQGHRNPPMPFSSVEYVAADVKLGAFKLNPHMVAQLRGAEPVDVSQARLPDSVHARASRLESGFAIGDPASPRIGDLRVTFEQLRSPQVSIVARQTRDTFEPYRAASGGSVELVVMGIASADTMFAGARSANSFGPRAWLLRCFGFVLMAAGLRLVLSPFSRLGEVAPVVGGLMRFGVAIVCGLVALCLSLVTVAAAWIRFRPSVGIWLLASAAILASLGYCATRFGKKPRAASLSA